MGRQAAIGGWAALAVWIVGGCSAKPEQKAAPPRPVPAVVSEAAPVPAPAAASAEEPSLADLRRTLTTTDDSRTRVLVLDRIATLGGAAKDALEDILTMTADPEPRVRWHAARAIGLIGEDAIRAVPKLVALLEDADAVTAAQAAAAIRHIRVDDDRSVTPPQDAALYAAAVEPLVKVTVHPDPRVRRAAVSAIRVLDVAPETLAGLLVKTLADNDPSVILPALHTLADMDDAAVPVLAKALEDPEGRYWAAVALTEIGPEAAPAASALATLAAKGESEERLQAMLALAAIGPAAAETAVPTLIETLRSNDRSLTFAAAFALGKMRARDADAVLTAFVEGDDPFLGEVAAWARAQIAPDDAAIRQTAIAKLRAGLSSDLPKVRSASVSGLSDLADTLDPANRRQLAATFLSMLTDADPSVGMQAGAALVRLGGDAVEALRGGLAKPDLRGASLEILSAIGPPAEAAVADITGALSDPDEALRGEAATALAAIGPAAAPAVERLGQMLADESEPAGGRYASAYALGRIGPAASPSLDMLHSLSKSEDELMATVAIWAVLKIEPGKVEVFDAAIPRLRKALRAESDLARMEAAVALGEIGPAAQTAIPILELVGEDDPVRAVRSAATDALAKIRGG
jgi:HEAT repeat protein